mgnify:CR=1 FL=1
MAKGLIPIKAAERLSEQYNCPVIVIYAIEDTGDRFTVTTYGKSKALCRHAADLGRKLAKAILNGEIIPAEKEPTDVPNEPAIFRSI